MKKPPAVAVFPHAGGSTASYRRLLNDLEAKTIVLWMDRPGSGRRRWEAPLEDPDAVVADQVRQLQDQLEGEKDIVLFGHSLGAAVAAGVAYELRATDDITCRYLIVSGRNAPHAEQPLAGLADMGDSDLVEALMDLGGRDAAALQDPGMRELFLPFVRSELSLADNWPTNGLSLDVPIAVMSNTWDPAVTSAGLSAWADTTESPVCQHLLVGGHFAIEMLNGAVLRRLLWAHAAGECAKLGTLDGV